MSVYKRGKFWWYDFWWNGEHVQRSTRQGSKRVAVQMEAAYRTQLAKGEVGIQEPKPVPVFWEFAETFRNAMATQHAAKPKTVTYYSNGLNRLLEFEPLRNARLNRVDEELVAAYIAKRKGDKNKSCKKAAAKPLQVSTINRELEVLRHLLRTAQERKILGVIPRIHLLAGENGRERVLTHAEEETYLNVARQPLRDIATIILDTGLRPEEAFRMRWENVHFDPAGDGARYGFVHNPFGKTKNARRNIPLTARAKALLEMRYAEAHQPADGWVFPAETRSGHVERVKSQHAAAMKSTNLRWFVLYSLRHTMLTRLGESGADAFTILKIGGHSSITISQRYVHPTPERVEAAFQKFETYNQDKKHLLASSQVQ